MRHLNLKGKHIYFIGIGGVSMSGLAMMLHHMGYHLSGSDREPNQETYKLTQLGIPIFYGQRAENISDTTDLVIYTAAIHADNPELKTARDKGIECWGRAKLLGELILHYPYSVCVAGTHGKTTTTSMLTHLLRDYDPTVTVGAYLAAIGGNFHLGSDHYFLVESCEYNDSFFQFNPYLGVILNVEFDHPDHFKDLHHVLQSFNTFAKNARDYLVINHDIHGYEQIIQGVTAKVVSFGQTGGDHVYQILDNHTFVLDGQTLTLPVAGHHNIQNAVASILTAKLLGIPSPDFTGYVNPKRRLEYKGETAKGAIVLDDYAHHPTEITVALAAVRTSYPQHHIYCLFQPHTYSRTAGLLHEFSQAFTDADTVLLLNIYAAREIDTGEVHSRDLLSRLAPHQNAVYFDDNQDLLMYLEKNLDEKSVLITMGATQVYLLGEAMLSTELSTLSTI